ncbi:hypothetical protein HELRODRAFT_170269 [Helobdella robusta]|uniref:Uncharacterized protein n=1 Tax=Helobdella robusta TaxID=6412 RepID=T1F2V1_HELRO|nr:hypothetical protein HELRODRAFT_170269 [Helobdella robusta]ESO07726.1 hypothetical protein HELRODRAFT_170269 [Helobdella robusta]
MYRHLTSIQYIDNYEIHWSLGALLHKTKLFPLRNIEKASQKLSKKATQSRYPANAIIIFICLLLLLTVLLYCCSLYMWPAKSRRQVTISVSANDTDEHVVDTKSYDNNMRMIRSRSYGFFANSAQNIV